MWRVAAVKLKSDVCSSRRYEGRSKSKSWMKKLLNCMIFAPLGHVVSSYAKVAVITER